MKCSECKAAGVYDSLADYLVLILNDLREEKPRPCRKYICQGHKDLLDMDGSKYKIEKTL